MLEALARATSKNGACYKMVVTLNAMLRDNTEVASLLCLSQQHSCSCIPPEKGGLG
jgi:hypothetical protein